MKLSITSQQTIVIAFLSIHENTLFVMFCRLSQKYIIYLWNIFPQIFILPLFALCALIWYVFLLYKNTYFHVSTFWIFHAPLNLKIWTFWRTVSGRLFSTFHFYCYNFMSNQSFELYFLPHVLSNIGCHVWDSWRHQLRHSENTGFRNFSLI